MSRKLIFGYLLLLPLFTGCSNKVIVNSGYDFASANFNKIVVGKDTITNVFQKLGSPTLRSTVLQPNGDFYWYYATEQKIQSGVFFSKTEYKKLYLIKFNKYGTVQEVKTINKENKIKTIRETNKVTGQSKGIFKELFSGMGKNIERYSK